MNSKCHKGNFCSDQENKSSTPVSTTAADVTLGSSDMVSGFPFVRLQGLIVAREDAGVDHGDGYGVGFLGGGGAIAGGIWELDHLKRTKAASAVLHPQTFEVSRVLSNGWFYSLREQKFLVHSSHFLRLQWRHTNINWCIDTPEFVRSSSKWLSLWLKDLIEIVRGVIVSPHVILFISWCGIVFGISDTNHPWSIMSRTSFELEVNNSIHDDNNKALIWQSECVVLNVRACKYSHVDSDSDVEFSSFLNQLSSVLLNQLKNDYKVCFSSFWGPLQYSKFIFHFTIAR